VFSSLERPEIICYIEIVMVAAARGAPLGLVRRVLDRAQRRADKWLDGMQ
jgi:hypothetical protein